ncbi:ABC transporter ATP-binding protein [Thermoleptolyngbya sichuanensis XZ-Cy5]|uniref:ABC transporter ATP-binding protein n=1 Tax=Thermoleptolyngbya sichuanensis TaxID=2885951 RepID=UPI00240DFC6D|nr:ABC transporter ATP-binding protein [Thermoleptolyngbya sichuanensis]MDG2617580.1 ABC transporter ATP-binding protein [Thermoleptolyngbya sichuanensis XZ-Cy5]
MTQSSVSASASPTVDGGGVAPIPYDIPSTTVGVSLRSVTKKYGPVTAVENITLDIPPGSYCCLLGPSGCGKTTTMRMIAGHEDITQGDVYIGDLRVNDLPPAQRSTAMMFQNYALFPHKTVWQNVEFGLRMRDIPKPERDQRVGEILEIVGLSQFASRKPAQLSGGQQQRVALARSLVTRPQVLMLDEPLSALDENLRVKTRGELRRLQKQFGMTFIQVTHNQDEAYSLSDMIVVMDHGRIDQVGTPQEIFVKPISQFVAKFTGDNNIFKGTVCRADQDAEGYRVQMEVPKLGTLLCRGDYAQVGAEAACSVRADRVKVEPLSAADTSPRALVNQVTARIVAIEFTGYVTRVTLALEKTGQEVLYKVRSTDWVSQALQEGQVVALSWLADDCVFLSH